MTAREEVSWRRILEALLAVLLVLAAVAVLVPSHRCSPISSNELAAVAALRTYLGAQNQFHRKPYYGEDKLLQYANPWDGSGFPDLYEVGGRGSGGEVLKFIDLALARAAPGGRQRAGYLFCDIVGRAGEGPYNHATDCGLCAYPAEYQKKGRNTFIIDITGVVYQKDTKGVPVRIYPANLRRDGWRPVESDW